MKPPLLNSLGSRYGNALQLLLSIQELFSKVVFYIPHLSWPAPLSGQFLTPGFWSPVGQCPNFSLPSEIASLPSFPVNVHCVGSWFVFCFLHLLPPPRKQFLFLAFPNPLGLEVKETTANPCRIQHFPSSPLQWIAFCSRILEKYANFISRRMAYSSCFYWNESAVRKQGFTSVVPTFLRRQSPSVFAQPCYMRIHLGPSCAFSEFQVTCMTI